MKLEAFEGPPSARDMRGVVNKLVRDNELERARAIADVMLEYTHQEAVGDDDFYYWLGVHQTLHAIAAGAFDRWRRRADAKLRRSGKAATT
jgi:hypothetical protein